LACAKNEKYATRLKDFIGSYGFKNNSDVDVNFVFLVEDEDRPSFLPTNYIWHNCFETPMSCRLLRYIKEVDIKSKWVMQVDDDSSTDLDKTYEFLVQFYNHEDPMILMGGRNTDLEMTQQKILRLMCINNFLFKSKDISKFDTHPYFVHAWEPSIISQKGIERIKQWNRLEEYFDLCLKNRPTFGDQTPYVAAKLSKVPIVECSFMSPFNKHQDYTALNPDGRFSHIHYVTDKWEGFNDFKQNMIDVKNGKSIKLKDKKENLWEFWGGQKDEERFYGVINLNEDGTVGLYYNDNEFFWNQEENQIVFLNAKKQKTSILSKVNDNQFEGQFLFNKSINHIIKKKIN
jgi:hypothetical protein